MVQQAPLVASALAADGHQGHVVRQPSWAARAAVGRRGR
jgi:hypothetical protein